MQQLPSITEEEFQKGCQAFHESAVSASSTNLPLQVAFDSGTLSIRKEYLIDPSRCSTEENTEVAQDHNDDWTDHEDHEVIDRAGLTSGKDKILVEFSILRSPIYQVPVLWFTLNRVPSGVTAGIKAVYQYIVPEAIRSGLRHVGIMGAISIANHPISDLPAFFIHPCNTAEALEEIRSDGSCSPEAYLLMWLGLVGPALNLYVPSQLLLARTETNVQAP